MKQPKRMSLLLVSIAVAGLLAASCADTETADAASAAASAASQAADSALNVADAAASDAGEALAGLGATAADAAAAAADATAAGAEAAAAGAEAAAATAAAQAALAAAEASQAAADLAQATAEGNQEAVAAAEEALAAAQAAADAASADAAAAQSEADAARQQAAAAQAEAEEARAEAAAAQAEAAAAQEEAAAAQEEAAAAQEEAAAAQATARELMREAVIAELDTNGDGDVLFGVATAGPRDDGAYYQALVETVEEFAAAHGFSAPVIVDNIQPADAATELRNLAEQPGMDVLAIGAGEIAEPLAELTEEYSEIFWYCNCGAGYPQTAGLAQSQDDGSQIGYSAGYATGILLRDSGGDSVHFLGCCDLGFEIEAYMSFEMGLQAVDPNFTLTYVPTGNFPYDFDNISGATEAFNSSVAEGADAVYPYLGGAHEPVVALANENDVITMSAGASDVCERTDLDYDIAVQFDAGDYIDTVLERIADGVFGEGETLLFSVGAFPFVGAKMCNATPEQQAEYDAELARIAADTYAEAFFGIKAEAYGF